MKYKGIIFDLDGVICSTDHYHYLAWKALADRLGVYFDETINNRLRGVSRMASLDIVLERSDRAYTPEGKAAFAEEKNNTYRELLKRMSPADLSPEVKETLDALRSRGLLLGIGSSSKNTKFILRQIGLGDYFDKISDGTNITRSKPDPEVFLKAADYDYVLMLRSDTAGHRWMYDGHGAGLLWDVDRLVADGPLFGAGGRGRVLRRTFSL